MELIKEYDLNIHYHPGKVNVVADALSREPCLLNSLIKLEQSPLHAEMERFGLELVSHGFLDNWNYNLCWQIKLRRLNHETKVLMGSSSG